MTHAQPVSFPDDLDQNPLAPASIKFAFEDLFPRTKVEIALGYGNDDFTPLSRNGSQSNWRHLKGQ